MKTVYKHLLILAFVVWTSSLKDVDYVVKASVISFYGFFMIKHMVNENE